MPKKFKGENTRVTKAKAIKAAAQEEKTKAKRKEQEKKEEQYWMQGANVRKMKKKEREAEKQAEKEAKALEKQEIIEKEMGSAPSKPLRGKEKTAAKRSKKALEEAQLRQFLAQEAVEGSGLDAALAALESTVGGGGGGKKKKKGGSTGSGSGSGGGGGGGGGKGSGAVWGARGGAASDDLDRHPERRMKSAYKAYMDRELPIMQEEKPGLRLSQYKQLIFKKWQKAPENPMNQASLAYNAKMQGSQVPWCQLQLSQLYEYCAELYTFGGPVLQLCTRRESPTIVLASSWRGPSIVWQMRLPMLAAVSLLLVPLFL